MSNIVRHYEEEEKVERESLEQVWSCTLVSRYAEEAKPAGGKGKNKSQPFSSSKFNKLSIGFLVGM
jgi:hypothetical protein